MRFGCKLALQLVIYIWCKLHYRCCYHGNFTMISNVNSQMGGNKIKEHIVAGVPKSLIGSEQSATEVSVVL